jgi:biopolymer transport protein ExbD
MRFQVRKRRQPPAIIIVALIDILIVLLIFMMATTSFKQQPALRLALPESSQAKRPGASEDAPLIISIEPSGNLRFGPSAIPVTVERLRQELRAAAGRTPNLVVAISADRSAPVGQVIKVSDAAKEAGVRTVNMFTKEAGQGSQ